MTGPSPNAVVSLPAPTQDGRLTVEQAIARRRSRRSFGSAALLLPELSQLLWALQGVTGADGQRSAPSAERTCPLEVFVATGHVTGLPEGLHCYEPETNRLHQIASVDLRAVLRQAALDDQPWVEEAGAVLAVAADLAALDERFGHQPPAGGRGRRYADIETGAAAQNAHLVAESLGLAFLLVAGYDDERVRTVLALEPRLAPTALLLVGRHE